MRTAQLLTALGILAGGVAAVPGTAAADAIMPIGPDQSFSGLVNGVHDKAHITVGCFGPTYPGQTGHPIPGQTVAVAPGPAATKDGGYTGSLGTSVVVAFSAVSTGRPVVLKAYGSPQEIPAWVSLPCYGTGTIGFFPAPTSETAVPDEVTVTFVPAGV